MISIEAMKNHLDDWVNDIKSPAGTPIKVVQQKETLKHLSVIGADGRLTITPMASGIDIGLSYQSLTKRMTPFMRTMCGRDCDGYKQTNKSQPFWRVRDLALVEKAVRHYATLPATAP